MVLGVELRALEEPERTTLHLSIVADCACVQRHFETWPEWADSACLEGGHEATRENAETRPPRCWAVEPCRMISSAPASR
jgi:hypothetical protein